MFRRGDASSAEPSAARQRWVQLIAADVPLMAVLTLSLHVRAGPTRVCVCGGGGNFVSDEHVDVVCARLTPARA